jgi:hypothetical protein
MKLLFIVACVGLLCSCSSMPVMHSSINGYSSAPTSALDPRMQRPQFYMDEHDSMPWLNEAPRNNR